MSASTAKGSTRSPSIIVVSDGTGRTAERVVRAALMQFPDMAVEIEVFPNVHDSDRLSRIVRRASDHRALLVDTFVGYDMRRTAASLAKEHRVTAIDLIGNLLQQLGTYLHARPDSVPGRMHEPDEEYFDRVHAINFAVKADDGRDLQLLARADIILVGVAGTAKTPLAIHLADAGYRVANLRVRAGQKLPPELDRVDQRRVMALTIEPACLVEVIEGRRPGAPLLSGIEKLDRKAVLAEVEWADELFAAHPDWPVVDVTRKPNAETAATITRILNDRAIGRIAPTGTVNHS